MLSWLQPAVHLNLAENLEPPFMLTEETLHQYAVELARLEPRFRQIIARLGPPPLWGREPGFPALVLIILEQQVSLASARAAYNRLVEICPALIPERFLELGDEALRGAGFSRQKTAYCRGLAQGLLDGRLDLHSLADKDDEVVRQELMAVKGIGAWTADIYLLMALRRADIWPVQDRALAVAVQRAWGLAQAPTPAELEQMGEAWRPYRAVAARLLWHYYLNNNRG
jgi:DNA-3-methyladenine glycosylase II